MPTSGQARASGPPSTARSCDNTAGVEARTCCDSDRQLLEAREGVHLCAWCPTSDAAPRWRVAAARRRCGRSLGALAPARDPSPLGAAASQPGGPMPTTYMICAAARRLTHWAARSPAPSEPRRHRWVPCVAQDIAGRTSVTVSVLRYCIPPCALAVRKSITFSPFAALLLTLTLPCSLLCTQLQDTCSPPAPTCPDPCSPLKSAAPPLLAPPASAPRDANCAHPARLPRLHSALRHGHALASTGWCRRAGRQRRAAAASLPSW